MRLTKNDKARVIVQAVYGLPSLPTEDDSRVVKMAKGSKVAIIDRQHKQAVDVLLDRVEA